MPMPEIPASVVEAAARARWMSVAAEHEPLSTWDGADEAVRLFYRREARIYLSAVPWKRWEALRKAAQEVVAADRSDVVFDAVVDLALALDALEDDNGD